MTDAPRTIWAWTAPRPEHPRHFWTTGIVDGPAHIYHHDAVVRELVEAAQDIVDRAAKAEVHDAFVTIPVDHIRELAAALAKIAQEGKP